VSFLGDGPSEIQDKLKAANKEANSQITDVEMTQSKKL
jgi:hypothetical protein